MSKKEGDKRGRKVTVNWWRNEVKGERKEKRREVSGDCERGRAEKRAN